LFSASGKDLDPVAGTIYCWAELRQAAREEGVVHLDDLLLRRVRLGLLVNNGGMDQMTRIRAIVQPELGWDDARWQAEEKSYSELWKRAYRL
jgi:glycerol-3-phosphate dehydrogenase